jgi:hypothetical protein
MGWFSSIKHGFDYVADKTKDAAVTAANDTKNVAETAAKDAYHAGKEAVGATGHAFSVVENSASRAAVSAWKATSDEASAIASSVEKGGLKIGATFIQGAVALGKAMEKDAVTMEENAIKLGEYLDIHACDIALGSALSAALVTIGSGVEGAMAMLAATCGSFYTKGLLEMKEKTSLDMRAQLVADGMIDGIYAIPSVSKMGHKSDITNGLATIIKKACIQSPEVAHNGIGQFIAGAVIYGITKYVCEGKLPQDYFE